MYLLLDEEIKKLIFKESRIVPCHKLRRQEKICNEQCLMQFIMINRREDSGVGSNRGEV